MAVLVVDANVLIALFDERDALHARAKNALKNASAMELVLPASAYAEMLVGAFRIGLDRAREIDAALASIPVTVVPLTAGVAQNAARLRAASESLRLGDALVLGTGAELHASVLTADRRLARHARVKVI